VEGDGVQGNGIGERVHDQMARVRADLAELVSIRSTAIGPGGAGKIDECGEAAEWVLSAFAATGVKGLRLIPTPGGCPAVYGHTPGPRGVPTVLWYGYYDVPPVTDEQAWQSPPFQLSERDGRWYGHGAADSKGNVLMHLTVLRALGGKASGSLKLMVDGSGQGRAGGLIATVASEPDLLRADAILVCGAGNGAAAEVFAHAYPGAEIILGGLHDPSAYASNESVDPREIERIALSEALFLQRYAMTDAP
jgi:acetylornithine deacetylase/succinyl-diaminopimelate desuccinylase-like protein